MNFRTILIAFIILGSFVFSKSIYKQRNTNQVIIKKESSQTREEEEIITIDFEGDISGWTQDTSNGWELTTDSYNSATHSYNSPDDNDSGDFASYDLFSAPIELDPLGDGEIMHFKFWLNCDMPDFIQEDDPSTVDDESTYLADYYGISIMDLKTPGILKII